MKCILAVWCGFNVGNRMEEYFAYSACMLIDEIKDPLSKNLSTFVIIRYLYYSSFHSGHIKTN